MHLSLYDDETSALCHWQIPEAHFLEAWSDARAYDGTVSIVQPLIAPLYGGKSAHEVLAAMSDRPERSGYDIVRESLEPDAAADGRFRRTSWRRWLHDGVVPDTAFAAEDRSRESSRIARAMRARRQSRNGRARRTRDLVPQRPVASSTAASPTTAGCRSCRSRSRS